LTANRKIARETKSVDEEHPILCAAGIGLIREEVWTNYAGVIKRYNLAFIYHELMGEDNGRLLGYDNRHGRHERHFKGSVETIEFESYEKLLERFVDEVSILRKEAL
jgi:hypothetical protein